MTTTSLSALAEGAPSAIMDMDGGAAPPPRFWAITTPLPSASPSALTTCGKRTVSRGILPIASSSESKVW